MSAKKKSALTPHGSMGAYHCNLILKKQIMKNPLKKEGKEISLKSLGTIAASGASTGAGIAKYLGKNQTTGGVLGMAGTLLIIGLSWAFDE
jgi:hypothetical protein